MYRFNSSRNSGVSLPGVGLFWFFLILVGVLSLGLVFGTILTLMGLVGCWLLEDGLEELGWLALFGQAGFILPFGTAVILVGGDLAGVGLVGTILRVGGLPPAGGLGGGVPSLVPGLGFDIFLGGGGA